jgi:oligopeptidase B
MLHFGKPSVAAPIAERRPVSRVVHNTTLTDDYGWLRADNWQAALRDPSLLPADITAYLQAENAHAGALLEPLEPVIADLVAEMRGRIKEDDTGVPVPDGPFDYYERYREGGQHPLICRRPRGGDTEHVMLDGDALSEGKAFFEFGGAQHSDDHRLVAWSFDDRGSEYYTLHVRDLTTGADLADRVPDTDGDAVWSTDGTSFFYIRLDENHRPLSVYRHRLGTTADQDELVFQEPDTTVFVQIGRAKSGGLGFITGSANETTWTRVLDLTNPETPARLVLPAGGEVKSNADFHPSLNGVATLLIRTNDDGAEDYKIVAAPLATPDKANWVEIVPHSSGVLITSFAVFRDWIVRLERENALPRVVVREIATGTEHIIAFDEQAYALGISDGAEFDTDTLRFVYSSMTTPTETWDYDMRRRTRILRKRQEVPSGHNPSAYVTRRLFATAADGETVPISLLARADTPLDGSAPLLLYGYGSYGSSMPASFSTGRLSFVDRGFVFAIAHIRGGMEKGYRWYRQGKREHKTNTFTDFIACAEHLIAKGYTQAGKIVARGGSAGGMLMGAVANMRPDLFAGIVAEVPFVDVISTMLDDTLPLTPPEWLEWGDPIRDVEAFHRMLGYSPYDNVAPKAYPSMMVLAGVSDPRVTYWEPAKWVARLRATKTGDNPILFITNMDTGHGGAAGRFDRLEEQAKVVAFALVVVGSDGRIRPWG